MAGCRPRTPSDGAARKAVGDDLTARDYWLRGAAWIAAERAAKQQPAWSALYRDAERSESYSSRTTTSVSSVRSPPAIDTIPAEGRIETGTGTTPGHAINADRGAEGEIRTHTTLRSAVFKTAASAGSATSAAGNRIARRWGPAGDRRSIGVLEATSGFEALNRGFAGWPVASAAVRRRRFTRRTDHPFGRASADVRPVPTTFPPTGRPGPSVVLDSREPDGLHPLQELALLGIELLGGDEAGIAQLAERSDLVTDGRGEEKGKAG